MNTLKFVASAFGLVGSSLALSVSATTCKDLPTAAELRTLLIQVETPEKPNSNPTLADFSDPQQFPNGGRAHHNWLTEVDSYGYVCAVVTSTPDGVDITNDTTVGLGHREASARKAYTAAVWSNSTGAIAAGNLFFASLPGPAGSFSTAHMSIADPYNIYGPPSGVSKWGTTKDPMVGKLIGGFYPHAGGLALFDSKKHKVGAIGISGDSNCTNHVIAWKMRELLRSGAYTSDNIPTGVADLVGGYKDQLVQDIKTTDPTSPAFTNPMALAIIQGGPIISPSGFGYPLCPFNPTSAQSSINGHDSIFRGQ